MVGSRMFPCKQYFNKTIPQFNTTSKNALTFFVCCAQNCLCQQKVSNNTWIIHNTNTMTLLPLVYYWSKFWFLFLQLRWSLAKWKTRVPYNINFIKNFHAFSHLIQIFNLAETENMQIFYILYYGLESSLKSLLILKRATATLIQQSVVKIQTLIPT